MSVNSDEFGAVLRKWFQSNNWPQSVPEIVAKSKGNKTGPWASQISHAMRGRHEPKVPFFLALAWFNQVVAERDFAGITDRRTIDRLRESQPLCHDNGTPFNAADFFNLYAGETQPPTEYCQSEETFTQEQLDQWVEGLRIAFRDACMATMAPPATTWAAIEKIAREEFDVYGEDMTWVREVIAGVIEPELQQAMRVRSKYGKTSPLIHSILKVIEANGGDAKKTYELLSYMSGVPIPKKEIFNNPFSAYTQSIT